MTHKLSIVLALLVLCGCGSEKNPYASNGSYGQLDNDKEFGVIVSERERESANVAGMANAVGGGAGTVAGAAASGAASGAVSQSGIFSPLANLFSFGGPSQSTPDTQSVVTIQYVIQKDSGQRITIDQQPQAGESILYPGQRAMIQYNNGYMRVYPGDVENRFH